MTAYFYLFDASEVEVKSHDIFTVLSTSKELDILEITSVIEENTDQTLLPAEVVILVQDSNFNSFELEFRSDKAITVKHRLGDVPVYLLSYDVSGQVNKSSQINGDSVLSSFQLKSFKQSAFLNIFRRRRGFVEGSDQYHFKNPSKKHSRRFLRVANLLSDFREIHFIAFCCLPFIREGVKTIYIDTPSLHCLVSAIQELVRCFTPNISITSENFQSYAASNYDFKNPEESIVLISASTSGNLSQEIADLGFFEPEQLVHVVFLGHKAHDFQVVCNLNSPSGAEDGIEIIPAVSEADCVDCKKHSRVIPIMGEEFSFAGPQVAPILLTEKHARAHTLLLKALVGKNVFYIGVGNGTGQTPHHFYINVPNLIDSDEFKRRFDYFCARSIPSRTKYFIYLDNDSRTLTERLALSASLESSASILPVEQIETISESNTQPVVVVAAVIESGRTLQHVSRRLRTRTEAAPIIYLAGLSKNSKLVGRKSLSRTLTFTHNPESHLFRQIFEVTIPAELNNSWMDERRLLIEENFIAHETPASKKVFDERLRMLNSTGIPIKNRLFLSNDSSIKFSLRPGFAFWPGFSEIAGSEADVYFTMASILQDLRAENQIRSNWLQQTVLDPENFGRFNDGIIQSALLRSAHPLELNYGESEEQSRQIATLIIQLLEDESDPNGNAAAEFLLALALHRLKLTANCVGRVIEAAQRSTFAVLLHFARYLFNRSV